MLPALYPLPLMTVRRHVPRRLTDPVAHHGEGPVWDVDSQRLLWVDMLAGRVMITELSGQTRAVAIPDPVAAFLRPSGGVSSGRVGSGGDWVVAAESSLWTINIDDVSAAPRKVLDLGLPAGMRCNDGATRYDGSLVIGVMAYNKDPGSGHVLTVTPDGGRHVSLAGTTIANGQQWLDELTVIFIDSTVPKIRRFSVNKAEQWINPVTVVDIPAGGGNPDGLCIDIEGGVWAAMWDGSAVHRWDSQGLLTDTVELPVPRPTSAALGGADFRTLFITTSAEELDRSAHPQAGSVFTVGVEIPGLPVLAWRSL